MKRLYIIGRSTWKLCQECLWWRWSHDGATAFNDAAASLCAASRSGCCLDQNEAAGFSTSMFTAIWCNWYTRLYGFGMLWVKRSFAWHEKKTSAQMVLLENNKKQKEPYLPALPKWQSFVSATVQPNPCQGFQAIPSPMLWTIPPGAGGSPGWWRSLGYACAVSQFPLLLDS